MLFAVHTTHVHRIQRISLAPITSRLLQSKETKWFNLKIQRYVINSFSSNLYAFIIVLADKKTSDTCRATHIQKRLRLFWVKGTLTLSWLHSTKEFEHSLRKLWNIPCAVYSLMMRYTRKSLNHSF